MLTLFIILLRSDSSVFGKCIECKISCTSTADNEDITPFYIAPYSVSTTTTYSKGQTLSQDKYDTESSSCKYCITSGNPTQTTCPSPGNNLVRCTCSKRKESIGGIEITIDEEEETLIEEGAIASVGVLAVAALVPPPLPMFPPLGVPQPLAIQGGITQIAGGGVLPSAALTVSN